jgi:hypothetical protein
MTLHSNGFVRGRKLVILKQLLFDMTGPNYFLVVLESLNAPTCLEPTSTLTQLRIVKNFIQIPNYYNAENLQLAEHTIFMSI